MPQDKSFFYGALCNRLFDPQLAEARQVAVDPIAEGASVLDVGRGTGLLCFELREHRGCRVAEKAILIDAVAPLPNNAGALGIHLVEHTFGRDHLRNFKAYIAAGGIGGALEASDLPINVEHRSLFSRDCREAVMVSAAS